jgi:hypothetical protein
MMAIQKILLPYNFTSDEERALRFVVYTLARKKDVEITLFHTYTPLPEVDVKGSPALAKMRGPILSLSEELREKEKGLESARQYLLENGFSEDKVNYIFKKREKSVVDEIIETVKKGRYRGLVLSHRRGRVKRMFIRGVNEKILSSLKDVTVCIVT